MTLLIFIFGFLLSAFFSGIETGSYSLNRIRLKYDISKNNGSAIILDQLLKYPHRFIFSMLIGNNLAIYLVSYQTTQVYLKYGDFSNQHLLGFLPWSAEVASTLSLMIPLFLFAEMLPKNLFRNNADRLMRFFSFFIKIVYTVILPLALPLDKLFHFFLRDDEKSKSGWGVYTKAMLMEKLILGKQQGLISSYQSRMMEQVIAMHRLPVRILMRDINPKLILSGSATVRDLKIISGKQTGSAFLVVENQKVVGLIKLQDVISRKLPDKALLKPYIRDVLSIDVSRNLKSVFYLLKKDPHHLAVIIDKRKFPVGVIGINDIARYIAENR